MSTRNLDKLFHPRAVAVVGASEHPGSVGASLMKNLTSCGFEGKVFAVNPHHAEILGRPCYPNLSAIGEPVDLIVVAVPISAAAEVIKEAGQAGAGAAIIISAGGKEVGEMGMKIEEEIIEAARASGIRILGPNCLGIIVPGERLNASFAAPMCHSGQVAMISQSGALCAAILDRAMASRMGFSHFVSIGSMADIDFGDVIDYLGGEKEVSAIVMYVESITNVQKFMSAARAVTRVKPVIVIKSGRSAAGARAAQSHTGAMVGDDAIYDAAFARAGVVRVSTITDLFDCAEALAKQKRPRGPKMAVLTNAGGPGVMATDAIMERGLELSSLSEETREQISKLVPTNASVANPVDILGDATDDRYREVAKVLLEAPEVEGLVSILTPQAMTDPTACAKALAPLLGKARVTSFGVWMGGPSVEEGTNILQEAGVPVFDVPERAVAVFDHMHQYTKRLELSFETPPNLPANLVFDRKRARAIIDAAFSRNQPLLTETEAKALLASYGIAVNRTEIATTVKEAKKWAQEIGYPVVMKIHSRDITHKTDVGGVKVGIADDDDLEKAFQAMMESAKQAQPHANILGVTVQPMIHAPHEVILGAKLDPLFGPVVLFGMGGIYAEAFADRAIGLVPLNLLLAKRMVEATKVYKVLAGSRSKPPANLPLLFETIVRLSYLVADFPEIAEMDANPVMVSEKEVLAADARVLLRKTALQPPEHLVILPYPTELETDWVTRAGIPVLIRPIRPEDEPLVQEFLEDLSADTIYFRFFHQVRRMPHEQMARFCQVDYAREIALVAIEQPPGKERIMGMCHIFAQPSLGEAELAVVVGDAWQREGLGRQLVSVGMEIARQKGIKRVTGVVLPENEAMLSLAKKLGFSTVHDLGQGVFRIEREM